MRVFLLSPFYVWLHWFLLILQKSRRKMIPSREAEVKPLGKSKWVEFLSGIKNSGATHPKKSDSLLRPNP